MSADRADTMRARLTILALAAAAALVPMPPEAVEQFYSRGAYPRLQTVLTGWSNRTPLALLDLAAIAVLAGFVALVWRDARRFRWTRTAWRAGVRAATLVAVLYLAFLATWGLNYRRVALEDALGVDYKAVSPSAALALALTSAEALNRLYPAPGAGSVASDRAMPRDLADAFAETQRRLGATVLARPGRPKTTWLDPYFRAASVDGMTDPFFLETLTLGSLLPVEQPMVVAHEWAHLAGYADEGEANFVGWLTCLGAGAPARYSAWLFLYSEVTAGLTRDERRQAAAALRPGPEADLAAIRERVRAQTNPTVSAIGWRVYDQYLRANGVEQGTRSYTDVVRLVLGTRLGVQTLSGVSGGAATAPAADPPRAP